jgi:Adenylate and Guanylate cyclase catalytic domain/FHA domain
VVGSTAYFARFGDEEGRQLQQLHIDLLSQCLPSTGGRIVDTAGDGVFACFPSAPLAATAMAALLHRVSAENEHRARNQQLTVRIGLHWGRVLSDGVQVTGDAVNLCSRIVATADPGQIRVSREMFQELNAEQRLACRRLGPMTLKGLGRDVELLSLEWQDSTRFPLSVRILETGQEIMLPRQDIVSFGRLEMIEGMSANDIVLALPDPAATRQISRWHFELRRRSEGFVLRAVSGQPISVDGQPVGKGDDMPIRPGSVVMLAGVMTLVFMSPHIDADLSDQRTGISLRQPGPAPDTERGQAGPGDQRPKLSR